MDIFIQDVCTLPPKAQPCEICWFVGKVKCRCRFSLLGSQSFDRLVLTAYSEKVPADANHVQLRLFLKDKLFRFDILAFDIFKKTGTHWAILTVAKQDNGERFIKHFLYREKLVFEGRYLKCKKSNRKAEALIIMSLLDKEEDMRKKPVLPKQKLSQPHFGFASMATGVWDYDSFGNLTFDQKYRDRRHGTIIFGRTALVVFLESRSNAQTEGDSNCRIDIPYGILEHTIPSVERGGQGALMLTLKSPPKMYRIEASDSLHLYTGSEPNAFSQLLNLSALSFKPSEQRRSLHRLCGLQSQYDKSAALCMVYRIEFSALQNMRHAWNFIKDFAASGVDLSRTVVPRKRTQTVEADYKALEAALANAMHAHINFAIAYQLMALVLEGTVSPANMLNIIPGVDVLAQRHGSAKTAVGVSSLAQQIPTPAPNVNGGDYCTKAILEMIETNISDARDIPSGTSKHKDHQHLALTYKATVTPTGLVLRGPEWGVSNRVLRRYAKNTESFMRVFFADEDGLSVFHDPRSSQEDVYMRFRDVLRKGITIAGRTFEFLGFSHASLRYHAAWFMAPFHEDGVLICARDVIQGLGDFSNIHCSAKCAARIGQAFSDTVNAVRVPDDAYVIETKDDVVRNGRTFSDGCGTISEALLQRVWRYLPPDRRSKRPTVLQIRYRGAKGVLSLDNALLGEQLHIRKSMTKYVAGEGWRDLELCGAAYRPLSMFLNHQFIKILEDLRVPLRSFFLVQDDALKALDMIVQHPLNAALFLGMSSLLVRAFIGAKMICRARKYWSLCESP